jgi:hypothetical protein
MTQNAADLPDRKFLICGLVRNCATTVEADVARIGRAFAACGNVRWLVIESDSTDDTVSVLDRLESTHRTFSYLSLGHLQQQLPSRTERIAFCRNTYLERLFQDPSYADVEYVVVCDLDGLNSELTSLAVASCWTRDDWDVCTANQRGPYYDIFALRHDAWCPADCWQQLVFLDRFRSNNHKNLYASVLSLMVTIPPDSDWIKVNSAFGGLAIYRKEVLRGMRYSGKAPDGADICEHVPLNLEITSNGGRIFLNPGLINAGFTEHTATLKPFRRLRKNVKAFLKHPVLSLFG